MVFPKKNFILGEINHFPWQSVLLKVKENGPVNCFSQDFWFLCFRYPPKGYFFAVPWTGSFGRILTMQLEPPKSNALHTPPPNTSYSTHNKSLLRELKSRTKPLSAVLLSLSQWFHDNPIPNLDTLVPIVNRNPWNISLSEFSTSTTHPVKLSYHSFPNQPPVSEKPNSRRHTPLKPKPKKQNLIHLT